MGFVRGRAGIVGDARQDDIKQFMAVRGQAHTLQLLQDRRVAAIAEREVARYIAEEIDAGDRRAGQRLAVLVDTVRIVAVAVLRSVFVVVGIERIVALFLRIAPRAVGIPTDEIIEAVADMVRERLQGPGELDFRAIEIVFVDDGARGQADEDRDGIGFCYRVVLELPEFALDQTVLQFRRVEAADRIEAADAGRRVEGREYAAIVIDAGTLVARTRAGRRRDVEVRVRCRHHSSHVHRCPGIVEQRHLGFGGCRDITLEDDGDVADLHRQIAVTVVETRQHTGLREGQLDGFARCYLDTDDVLSRGDLDLGRALRQRNALDIAFMGLIVGAFGRDAGGVGGHGSLPKESENLDKSIERCR